MNAIVSYIKESYDELRHKVTWPTWPELQSTAILVLIASIIISLVVFGLDTVSGMFLKSIFYR